jgi:glycosyltransferase involved in cell wall biosynthesis
MQEYSNIEIIIVDGLSIDETLNVVNRLVVGVDHNIISELDCGIYDAINKGIDIASGDYLIVLGADDVFYDNKVLNRVFLSDFKYADFIYGNVIFKSTNVKYDGKFNIIKLLRKNICHQAIFYHKSVYEKLGKYETKYKALGDLLFNIRCFESGDITIRYINEIISIYNDSGYSSTLIDTTYWKDLPENLKKYCSEDVSSVADIKQILDERDVQIAERDVQIARLNQTLAEMNNKITDLLNSNSWRLTAPLRSICKKNK